MFWLNKKMPTFLQIHNKKTGVKSHEFHKLNYFRKKKYMVKSQCNEKSI